MQSNAVSATHRLHHNLVRRHSHRRASQSDHRYRCPHHRCIPQPCSPQMAARRRHHHRRRCHHRNPHRRSPLLLPRPPSVEHEKGSARNGSPNHALEAAIRRYDKARSMPTLLDSPRSIQEWYGSSRRLNAYSKRDASPLRKTSSCGEHLKWSVDTASIFQRLLFWPSR